jgi:hypothetical protein
LGLGVLQVVGEFLVLVSIVDREFEFALFGPQDHRLTFHAANHVEGGLGCSAQGQLQQVVLDARLDGLAQRRGDFKEAVGRAQTFDALVGPLVVVVADPEADAFPGRIETLKLGAAEELLPDRFPEALDLAQGHGMVGPGLEVVGAILPHLGLEAGGAAPVDELPAIVGEHLFGGLVFAGGDPKDLQDVLGGVAAEELRPHEEARVIVHEGDQIGVTAPEPEGEDVRLPHLVGGGPLEETRADQVAPGLGGRLHQPLRLEGLTDRLRTGGQKEDPPEQLGDAFDAAGGFLFLELEDLVPDGLGQLCSGPGTVGALQRLLALDPVAGHPLVNGGIAHPHLLGHQLLAEALFEVEFDGAQSLLESARPTFSRRSPPRGGGVLLLLYWFILLHVNTSLSLKCQPISCTICSHDMVASTKAGAMSNHNQTVVRG